MLVFDFSRLSLRFAYEVSESLRSSKPPAVRVRVRGYTNKSPFLTIEVLKPPLMKGKVI